MRAEIDFAGHENQGARDNQEDYYAFEELESGGLVLVVADGVGGETGGELASRAAVHGFLDSFAETATGEAHRFLTALKTANRDVARVIDERPSGECHMATTLLALQVKDAELHWISVGDSPLLLFRRGELLRLNQDHSGKAEHHQPGLGRNALVSALTGGKIHLVDHPSEPYPVDSGDIILAATDGIWTLSLEEIAALLAEHAGNHAAKLAALLIEGVRQKAAPKQDNVTVAIIKIEL